MEATPVDGVEYLRGKVMGRLQERSLVQLGKQPKEPLPVLRLSDVYALIAAELDEVSGRAAKEALAEAQQTIEALKKEIEERDARLAQSEAAKDASLAALRAEGDAAIAAKDKEARDREEAHRLELEQVRDQEQRKREDLEREAAELREAWEGFGLERQSLRNEIARLEEVVAGVGLDNDARLRRLDELARRIEDKDNEIARIQAEHAKERRRLLKELDLRLLAEEPDHAGLAEAHGQASRILESLASGAAGTDPAALNRLRAYLESAGTWDRACRKDLPALLENLRGGRLTLRQAVRFWELALVHAERRRGLEAAVALLEGR